MNKLLLAGFVVAGFFLISASAEAASLLVKTPNETDTVEFTIPEATIAPWRGSFPLNKVSTTESVPTSVNQLVSASIKGQLDRPVATPSRTGFNPELVYAWLSEQNTNISTEPIEPSLVIASDRAINFTPPQIGQTLDLRQSVWSILAALDDEQAEANLFTREIKPTTELGSTNNLGIKELVGRGVSTFNGSPKNRRTNIRVGVEKFRGVIIKQGQEFSFNQHLGPVEKEFGFVPELVIKRTGTVPELGGGLCQVSSTTFRAAMDAGLPITARKNHSYAVQYYAPQGTDATIYPGAADLKFINDTPGNILVWPYFKDENTLIYDFYGTKDDREVVLEKPLQWDRKSDGSMKASWTRIVKNKGKEDKVTFQSVYLPPALFHKQEEFVPTAAPGTTPTTPPTTPPTDPGTTPAPDPEPDPLVPPTT